MSSKMGQIVTDVDVYNVKYVISNRADDDPPYLQGL